MVENPYKAPTAPVEVRTQLPGMEAAAKKIRNGWIAGVISAGITLIFVGIALSTGRSVGGIDAYSFVDIGIMLGLSYGVYRKSRICATLLLLVFLTNKILMWVEAGTLTGLPLAVVFLWFFGQGVVGTFQYHKLEQQGAAVPAS